MNDKGVSQCVALEDVLCSISDKVGYAVSEQLYRRCCLCVRNSYTSGVSKLTIQDMFNALSKFENIETFDDVSISTLLICTIALLFQDIRGDCN